MHAQFGVLVIGDEILAGKRQDKHFSHVVTRLRARGLVAAWYRVAGDDRRALVKVLRQTREGGIPVFCFGGIGATPDDNTRQAAAQAFGCRLQVHDEALALIEAQFGAAARPNRVRMAELPEGCLLDSQSGESASPALRFHEHHFFPGFPSMAWPMLDWVLGRYYPACENSALYERSVRVSGVPESELLDLMEALTRQYPTARLFSLPRRAEPASIELGFRGTQADVDAAMTGLVTALEQRRLVFEA